MPELNLERNLGLQQVLQARIKEIHDSIGEDSAILDRAFQGRIPRAVVSVASLEENREINALKQHGVNGEALFSELVTIYNQHHLSEVRECKSNDESPVVSTIVCSEAISML